MKNTPSHTAYASFMALAASAALILAGCSKTENGLQDGRTELKLTSTIEMTRATSPNTQATQIAQNEKVTVWVTDSGTSAALYAQELTVGSGGALTGGNKMYYPQTGNGVNIAALHGKFSFYENIPSSLPSSIDFSVYAGQSASGGSNYLNSDLLYASRGASRSSRAVSLTFYHLLSKLELNITKSAELTDEISSVTLDGVVLDGTFTPSNIVDISSQISRASGITTETTETGNISLGNSTTASNEAIVVPQSLEGKTLTFNLQSGGKLIYTFPGGTTFESGKKYVYNVTLKLTELTVTSTIEDWTSTDGANGDATMPDAS